MRKRHCSTFGGLPCRSALLSRYNVSAISHTQSRVRWTCSWLVTSPGDDKDINFVRDPSQTLSVTSACQVGRSLFITLLKHRQQQISGHYLIGNSLKPVLSCNLSSIEYICFWIKPFSFADAQKRKIWRQTVTVWRHSSGKINSEFTVIENRSFRPINLKPKFTESDWCSPTASEALFMHTTGYMTNNWDNLYCSVRLLTQANQVFIIGYLQSWLRPIKIFIVGPILICVLISHTATIDSQERYPDVILYYIWIHLKYAKIE